MKKYNLLLIFLYCVQLSLNSQTIHWEGKAFEISNVKASIVRFDGSSVLKVERDLEKLPFDTARLSKTVDEPTFVKLKDLDFENGTIEVKLLSQIQNPSPFASAQGFIGIAFRINNSNTAFESMYLRPGVGRSDNQFYRNHTVQYYSYPDFKFDILRKEAEGMYETTAAVALNEWITIRIEVEGAKAYLYVNNSQYSTFVVEKMKGKIPRGAIGLWVDIGTIGYFKDLKVIKK